MNKNIVNSLLMLLVTAVVAAAGHYLTEIRQPKQLEQIEEQRRVAQLQHAEVEQLLQAEAQSAQQADEMLRKWRARYMFIPATMETPDIIEYLEGLTTRGFESVDFDLKGIQTTPNYQYYTFTVRGTAYFTNLHDFIWHLETNREFYHVRDLTLRHVDIFDENPTTGIERRLSMVDFTFELDAFFGGSEGLSAPAEGLLPIPRSLLPAHYPAHNSFYPLVRSDLPPNDERLVNVENARLLSILGNRVIMEDENGVHELRVGDQVYLGEIVSVDPVNIIVAARLNKGGRTEVVELSVDTGTAPYQQARGRVQLRAIDTPEDTNRTEPAGNDN